MKATVLLIISLAIGAGSSEEVRNTLLDRIPEVLLDDGEAEILRWEIEDDPGLWGPAPTGLRHLESWRGAIRETVGGTSPAFLMQRNQELNPWLESEHPQQGVINRKVESGELGRLRSMNALEAYLLDLHAARYALLDRPSEMGVLILSGSTEGGERLRIYYLTDGDGLPPKEAAGTLLDLVERDVEAGWDARAFLHNHTFDFESEKGLLAIAAPSENDLKLIHALGTRLELDEAWIIDGFNSFEMDGEAPHEPWVPEVDAPQYFAVIVSDVDASVDWYCEAFGLDKVGGSEAEDGSWRIENLRNDRLFVEIIRDDRATEADRAHGFRKVGFFVSDVAAVADRVERVTGDRPRVLDFEQFGVRIIQLHDPEGNTIQLFSPREEDSSSSESREDRQSETPDDVSNRARAPGGIVKGLARKCLTVAHVRGSS